MGTMFALAAGAATTSTAIGVAEGLITAGKVLIEAGAIVTGLKKLFKKR